MSGGKASGVDELWLELPENLKERPQLLEYLRKEKFLPDSTPPTSRFIEALRQYFPLPATPEFQDACDLTFAMESILKSTIRNRHLLALICYHLKVVTKVSNDKIAEAISEACNDTITMSWVSRLIRAGELVSTYPDLRHLKDMESLNVLHRLDQTQRAAAFKSGNLNDKVNIFTAPRLEIVKAVNALKETKNTNPLSEQAQGLLDLAKSVLGNTDGLKGDYVAAIPVMQAFARLLYAFVLSSENDELLARQEKNRFLKEFVATLNEVGRPVDPNLPNIAQDEKTAITIITVYMGRLEVLLVGQE